MKEHTLKYLPLVVFIWFFNSFPLPHGLLYSALLTPVFMYWLWKRRVYGFYLWFIALWGIFAIIHLRNGAMMKDYFVSSVLVFTSLVFLITCRQWLLETPSTETYFRKLLSWNTLFVALAICVLPFAIGREILWYEVPISKGIASFPRLKLFTYEASYYGLLFVPLFLFWFWKVMLGLEKHWLPVLLAIGIPMLLVFSIGVWGGCLAAVGITAAIYAKTLWRQRGFQKLVLYGSFCAAMVLVLLVVFYPHNPLFLRLENIVLGVDTSAKGRLLDSFMFSFDLARSKNLLFGVGPGQIKVFAHDLIVNFYKYEGSYAEIVRIPNSMGEWLATYGLIGFAGKLVLEITLFFRHRVHNNLFNLSLFAFMFIYQFTGSFLHNTAEVIVWLLAFYARFGAFDLQRINTVQE